MADDKTTSLQSQNINREHIFDPVSMSEDPIVSHAYVPLARVSDAVVDLAYGDFNLAGRNVVNAVSGVFLGTDRDIEEEIRQKEKEEEERQNLFKIPEKTPQELAKEREEDRQRKIREKAEEKRMNINSAYSYISQNNPKEFKKLFKGKNKISVNDKYASFDNPSMLHCAIQHQNYEIANFLISSGANVNETDDTGLTPLAYAVEKEDVKLTELLLKNGANPNVYATNRYSFRSDNDLIEYAEEHQASTIQDLLIKYGADPQKNPKKVLFDNLLQHKITPDNIQYHEYHLTFSDDKKTPLMIAIETGQTELALHLIKARETLEAVDKNGNSVFDYAVKSKNETLITQIAALNPDLLSKADKSGETRLFQLVKNHDLETIQCLINAKANINEPNKNGETALYLALKNNDYEIAQTLMENGAKLYNKYQMDSLLGQTSLDPQIAELVKQAQFIDENKSGTITNSDSLTQDFKSGIPHQVLAMIENKENINKPIPTGKTESLFFNFMSKSIDTTILQCAVNSGNTEAVKYLLEHGANPNSNSVSNPLEKAFTSRNIDTFNLLLDHGANMSPDLLSDVLQDGNEEIIMGLVQHKKNISKEEYQQLLKTAIKKDSPQILNTLLENNVTFEGKTKEETQKEIYNQALKGNSHRIVHQYLENNADPNAKIQGSDNTTALEYAMKNHYNDIACDLIKHNADLTKPLTTKSVNKSRVPIFKHGQESIQFAFFGDNQQEVYPLEYALNTQNKTVAQELIDSGIKLYPRDVAVALHQKQPDIAQSILQKTDFNQKEQTQLIRFLIKQNDVKGLELLNQNGIRFDDKSTADSTLLLYATNVADIKPETVQFLLDHTDHQDIDKSVNGITPILSATNYGNASVVKLLLDNNAQTPDLENLGKIALRNSDAEILKLYAEKGYDIERPTLLSNKTRLIEAIEKDQTKKAIALIEAGANANASSQTMHIGKEQTPLSVALEKGNKEVAIKILETSDDLKLENKENQQLIDLILKTNDPKLIGALMKHLDKIELPSEKIEAILSQVPPKTRQEALNNLNKDTLNRLFPDSAQALQDKTAKQDQTSSQEIGCSDRLKINSQETLTHNNDSSQQENLALATKQNENVG